MAVHGIVTGHEGDIAVQSEPGSGTTFHVFFPLCFQDVGSFAAEGPDRVPPKGNERVLFVDDQAPAARLGEAALEVLGYGTSRVEALEVFCANPAGFDVVITDQTMPNLTGMELAKALLQTRPDIPIIL